MTRSVSYSAASSAQASFLGTPVPFGGGRVQSGLLNRPNLILEGMVCVKGHTNVGGGFTSILGEPDTCDLG